MLSCRLDIPYLSYSYYHGSLIFWTIFFPILPFLPFLLILPPHLVCDLQKLLSCRLDLPYLSYSYYHGSLGLRFFDNFFQSYLSYLSYTYYHLTLFQIFKKLVSCSLTLIIMGHRFFGHFFFNHNFLNFLTHISTLPCFRSSKNCYLFYSYYNQPCLRSSKTVVMQS